MNYAWFIRQLRRAGTQRGGVKTLRLGTIDPGWFADIQREAAWIIDRAAAPIAEPEAPAAGWTRPRGSARHFRFYSAPEQSDMRWTRSSTPRPPLALPGLAALSRLAAMFGSNLRNFRLSGLDADTSVSAHEENAVILGGMDAGHIVRFHLPVFSNMGAAVYLDDERFTFKERELYFFHHGSTHAAANCGDEVHYELVMDCILNRALFRNLFPGTPSADPGFRKSTPERAIVSGIPFILAEFLDETGSAAVSGKYSRRNAMPAGLQRHCMTAPSGRTRRKPHHTRRDLL
jgi:hypothetical protein